MLKFQSAVTIARPPAEVFPYLIDTAKQALWSDVPMRQLTPGLLAKGSRMEITFGKGPIKAVLGLEITSLEPDSRMAFTTFSGPIHWDGEYQLRTVDGGGTSVSQQGTLEFTGMWRLLQPIVGAEIKTGEIKELERLKAVVEKT